MKDLLPPTDVTGFKFQFLIGSMKGQLYSGDVTSILSFQFLIGSMKGFCRKQTS